MREKDGQRLSLVYQTSVNPIRQDFQSLIKQWWSEIGVEAARAHAALQCQHGVLLADRAVGADGEQAPPGPLGALAGREALVGVADVVELPAAPGGGAGNGAARRM